MFIAKWRNLLNFNVNLNSDSEVKPIFKFTQLHWHNARPAARQQRRFQVESAQAGGLLRPLQTDSLRAPAARRQMENECSRSGVHAMRNMIFGFRVSELPVGGPPARRCGVSRPDLQVQFTSTR